MENLNEKKQIEEMAKIIASVPPIEFPIGSRLQGRHIYTVTKIAEALYNADYRKQEWISVDERLPEDDGSTILYYDGEEVDACYFSFGTFNTIDTYDSSVICGVTHWMPLPEAPKMKGGEQG